ncbi:XrtA/PEP-CTERM system histidine kinase PrsK [Sphingomicrobium lutaoense]|uniref:histidine kinase n=1 Tax=Sphingomicrobium lutaoense TaxID=515949 RepID=A0A839YZJ9_9SPHN|nr:XrtA/PEP-CTERM system histidine kinase PrsK [Sphingomicrobium lutaoense]MBB3763197.1 putative PEP-CTERM system histidine kinase [Sphingomicrobium lutaoense]
MGDFAIAFWSHALAATLFVGLAGWQLTRGVRSRGQQLLLAAFAMTALWAWLEAVLPMAHLTATAETARNLVWVMLLYNLALGADERERQHGVRLVFASVAAVLGLQMVVNILPLVTGNGGEAVTVTLTGTLLHMTAAAGALILVHNVYGQAAPASRPAIRYLVAALAAVWAYDLNLYTMAYFEREIAAGLSDWRGVAISLTVPLFASSARPGDQWRIRLSRAATFQSLSLIGISAYLASMAILATALRENAQSDWLGKVSVALLAALTMIAVFMLATPRFRAWAKVKIAKHFFEHRYDYRSEWLRFTATLGAEGASPMGERVIKAFADMTDSPGGLLLALDEQDQLSRVSAWNWPGALLPPAEAESKTGSDFWNSIAVEGRILELDGLRRGWGQPADLALPVPHWLLRQDEAWIGIPLQHNGLLVGLVILAAPDYRRALDWEDFDLMKTAGRQAASNLAEALGQEALAKAQRFEEFNRRFAFIMHDIKNLVSQLSLLSRNAEKHADNPDFRADMVATLKSSVGKMNDLLSRLSPQTASREGRAEATPLRDIIAFAIASKRRDHDVRLVGDASLWAIADPAGLEQAVGHLLQNAIDASPADKPVSVHVGQDGRGVRIVIADEGHGMDADFVRSRLFEPFASTKDGGFGIGAFEARSLIAAMGGRLSVDSAPGCGTRFTIHLAGADTAEKRKIA